MGVQNGRITVPVSIHDVQQCLGVSDNDLGTLCQHPNIDKYAKYKPTNAPGITNELWYMGKNNNYGLTPVIVEGDSSSTEDRNAMSSIISKILSNGGDWSYAHPTGGANSPYRLADFRNYAYGVLPPIYMNVSDQDYYIGSGNLTFRATFPSSDTSYDTTYAIQYAEIAQFRTGEYYLWAFYSNSSSMSNFSYAKSDDPISENTVVNLQFSRVGTFYFVFALGNAAGNKFMTFPNSYRGSIITQYPIAVNAIGSGIVFDTNPDNIYLGGIIEGITNMSSITDEVYVVNNDRSIQMQFDVTIGAAMHIAHVSDFTCYFQGVHVPATRIQSNGLDISGEQSGTLPATTGSNTVPLIIDFANAFDSTDKNITTFESFEPILYYNRNWLFSFGDYDAIWTGIAKGYSYGGWNTK